MSDGNSVSHIAAGTHTPHIYLSPNTEHPFTPTSCLATQRTSPWLYIATTASVFILGSVASTVTYVYYAKAEPAPVALVVSPEVLVRTALATSSTPFDYGPNEKLSQPNFFADTLAAFIASKQSFVEADLSHMKIRYYDHGTTTFEADILTKGKEGSWWETPSGLYAVENKEPMHFSSFGP